MVIGRMNFIPVSPHAAVVFIHNVFHVPCHHARALQYLIWLWLGEYSGAVLSCFALSRSTIITDDTCWRYVWARKPTVCSTKPEDSINPLFTAFLYSMSWVRKGVTSGVDCGMRDTVFFIYCCFSYGTCTCILYIVSCHNYMYYVCET